MIYGEIKSMASYKGISKNLDKAIDYIMAKKYLINKIGKNEIDGDIIYFNCPDKPFTKDKEGVEFEYHKRYLDIHIVIEGKEKIGYAFSDECMETKEYSSEEDYGLMKGEIEREFLLDKKKFLILFPNEPHVALLKVDEVREIKKVIFKVEL